MWSLSVFQLLKGRWEKSQVDMAEEKENVFSFSFLALAVAVQIRNTARSSHQGSGARWKASPFDNNLYCLTAYSTVLMVFNNHCVSFLFVIPNLLRRYYFWKQCLEGVTTRLAALQLQLRAFTKKFHAPKPVLPRQKAGPIWVPGGSNLCEATLGVYFSHCWETQWVLGNEGWVLEGEV